MAVLLISDRQNAQHHLQNTYIFNVCYKHNDRNNRQNFPIKLSLAVFLLCIHIYRMLLIVRMSVLLTQSLMYDQMRNIGSVGLLDVMHNVVESLVMVSSEAWDCGDTDHRIAAASQS